MRRQGLTEMARLRDIEADGFARRARRAIGGPLIWLGVAFAIVAFPPLALFAASFALPPPDLAKARDRSAVVLDREGRLLRPFLTSDGRWKLPVTTADVDPRYLDMLVAYEDKRFWRHPGVDPLAMARAAGQSITRGRIVSGGSTLTMQVARLLEPREGRTLSAKLRQMARALDLERRLSKHQILDLYLALAPFGGNLEGVRAASLAWLGKEPRRLSSAEAALLVALPQAPEARRPDRKLAATHRARDRVLARAASAGLVTGAEIAQAQAEAIPASRHAFPNSSPHLAEQVVAERAQERVHRLTLDALMQRSLEQLARERAALLGPKLSVAILVVDHATGDIRASVGGADYFASERAGGVDLTRALRSPGSAMKPFIYALAFDNGLAHPETMLEDRPRRYGLYAPENFDQTFQGLVSARKALQLSLNIPTVELLAAIGPQRFVSRLREAGAGLTLPKDSTPGLALGLGGVGVTLSDLTRLYAGLARGGEVIPLNHRHDPAGGSALSNTSRPPAFRLVQPAAAWHVGDVLREAPPPASASPGRIAFKTGTSYGYRDAWAMGWDRRHTIGVWVGRADNGAVPGLIGRVAAAPILFDAFARIGLDPRAPAPPADALIAQNHALPPPLRHIRADAPKSATAVNVASLRIAFPPDGARIELAPGEERPQLSLKAMGGVAPFTWLVDGAPVASGLMRREGAFQPDGLGFVRISVIDAQGASDSVSVRLQ
jgi:penicillin-binding protein 1C